MPAIRGRELAQLITSAIRESGWSGTLTSRTDRNPRHFSIWSRGGLAKSVWVYVWTLTWANRSNRSEYRVQLTGVRSPLRLNPSGETVLLGYEPERGVFAAFDVYRHHSFSEGSNSIYTDIEAVSRAVTRGLAFDRRSTGEIVVGVRPDQIVGYIENAKQLHEWGSEPELYQDIEEAAVSPTEETLPPVEATERQRIVHTVSRLARSGNFRRDVLEAYGNRCAVTGLQLKVVQAAHVLPVSAPGSLDEVRNGIALSPTYHIAYDDGLIYLNRRLEMRLNDARANELDDLGLQGGLEDFVAPLGPISLPVDENKWPDKDLIEQANRFRDIPVR